jgi:uncharacterized membrane protein YedE/YeeE
MAEPLSPLFAIGGGLLIGCAASVLLLLAGRIAGVSGMVAAATGIAAQGPRRTARAFVIGLLFGAVLAAQLRQPHIEVTGSVPLLIVAGLLVGFGTRLGSGCTSGHGVCGVGRLSRRSIAATATFMLTAMAIVFVMRHAGGS